MVVDGHPLYVAVLIHSPGQQRAVSGRSRDEGVPDRLVFSSIRLGVASNKVDSCGQAESLPGPSATHKLLWNISFGDNLFKIKSEDYSCNYARQRYVARRRW